MGITLMHNFKPKVLSVDYVSPCWDNLSISINNGLVKIEPIEIECHSADSHGGKPYANHWENTKEEMKSTRIIKARILEN